MTTIARWPFKIVGSYPAAHGYSSLIEILNNQQRLLFQYLNVCFLNKKVGK
jgi:hypothetical protein